MAFGLTSSGFVPKRQEDIITELNAAAAAQFGDAVDVDPRDPLGQIFSIMSERLASLWALAESLDSAMSPITAAGLNLDKAVALTGITRLAASNSLAVLRFSGTAGTLVPLGTQVSKSGDSSIVFETIEDGTVEPGGTVDVNARATEAGALAAPAGTLTEIETPIANITSVTNPSDATEGRERETDSELRARQQEFLQAPGTSSVEGIRAALALVDNVSQVVVIENETNSTDGDGRPAKSFEAVVQGGLDADIAETIWESKPAGIETHGGTTVVVTDSQGVDHDINFSRPTAVEITISATITANSDPTEGDLYPVDGDDLVEAAILEYADTLIIGRDVFLSKIYSFINEVPGVIGISLEANKAGGPTVTDTIAIAVDEIADFDAARITVTS